MDRDRMVDQVVQQAIEVAAETDVITFDELNALLPGHHLTDEEIGQVLNRLFERGIQLSED